jgi:hypothetical protein
LVTATRVQDFEQAKAVAAGQAEDAGQVELERRLAERRQAVGFRFHYDHAEQPADDRRRHHADQHRAAYFPHAQRGDQRKTEQGKADGRRA